MILPEPKRLWNGVYSRAEEVKILYDQGLYVNQISTQTGILSANVSRYLDQIYGPEREKRRSGITKRTYSINESYFDILDTPEKAYILGLIAADGTVGRNTLRIRLKESDRHILESIKAEMGSDNPIRTDPAKKFTKTEYICKPVAALSINSHRIIKSLANLGIIPNKTVLLEFPKVPEHLMSHFIRGYFDGDGHIAKVNKNFLCTLQFLGTYSFLTSLAEILQDTLHIKTRVFKDKRAECWILFSTRRMHVLAFADYIYRDSGEFFLPRKRVIFEEWRALPCKRNRKW